MAMTHIPFKMVSQTVIDHTDCIKICCNFCIQIKPIKRRGRFRCSDAALDALNCRLWSLKK